MKRLLWTQLLLFSSLLITPALSLAEEGVTDTDTLCLPGIYQKAPTDCLPLGPSLYLSRMARLGITFPIKALPTVSVE